MKSPFLELLDIARRGSDRSPVALVALVHQLSRFSGSSSVENEDFAQDLLVKILDTPEIFIDALTGNSTVIQSVVDGDHEQTALESADGALRRYLSRCIKNRRIDAYKKRDRQKPVPFDEETTPEAAADADLKRELDGSLARLKAVVAGFGSEQHLDDFRQIVELVFEGRSLREQLAAEVSDTVERRRHYDAITKRHSRLRDRLLDTIQGQRANGLSTPEDADLDEMVIRHVLNRRPKVPPQRVGGLEEPP